MGKQLQKADAANGFMIAAQDDGPRELMRETFEQLGVDQFQLSRIKVPSAGVTQFSVPTLEGEDMVPTLEVILVSVKGNEKAWWREEFSGGGAPPDCSSHDGRTGIGVNSLDPDAGEGRFSCADCAWNQFGSARSGSAGKDCRDLAFLYFFRQTTAMPNLMVVPATSLKPLREYMMRLIENGKALSKVVTTLSVEKAQSKGGITYSQLALAYRRDLDEEEAERVSGIAATLKEVSKTAAVDLSAEI